MKFFFVALLVLAAFAMDDDNCGSDCFYSIAGGKLTVTTHHSSFGDVDDFCHDLAPWYFQRDSITEIEVVPGESARGIQTIGGCAFRGLHKVTKVTIAEGNELRSIGERAFEDCTSLTTVDFRSIEYLTSLGAGAFKGCTSLTTFTIPEKVSTLKQGFFEGCTSLTTVTLSGVETIEKEVFKGCTSLTTVAIPSSVTSIDVETFTGSSLATINVDSSNKFVAENGVLYQKYSSFPSDYYILIRYPPAKADESFVIPNEISGLKVKAINNVAFKGCDKLKELTLPSDCNTVNDDSFIGCSALKEFKLAEGNTNFEVPDGVLIDKSHNLYRYPPAKQCTGVACTAYEIPAGVTNIKKYAFEGCSVLATLTIPESLHTINDNAFDGCVGFTTFTVAPENTYFVVAADGALLYIYYKSSTEVVKFPAKSTATEYKWAHPDDCSIQKIGANAFEGCTTLTKMELPSNVTNIYAGAFKGCTGLTEINIPKEVSFLDLTAFEGCTGLTAINIEAGGSSSYRSVDGVFIHGETVVKYPPKKAGASYAIPTEADSGFHLTEIASHAFEGCNLLTSVSIHKNITSVEALAFKDCSELVTVKYEGLSSSNAKIDSFENCPKVGKICVTEEYTVGKTYYELSFGGKQARDCSKPEPTPGPTPGPEPTPEPTGQSSSAAAVIPSLAAVVAVFAMFF